MEAKHNIQVGRIVPRIKWKAFPGRSRSMQSSWTKGQASESILSVLISLFICQDGKLPVIRLAWVMCPPLSQKGELYVEGPVPLPTVGGREFSKGNQQLFSGEAGAELEWSAGCSLRRAWINLRSKKVHWCNWKFHFPSGCCSHGIEIRDALLSSFYLISMLSKVFISSVPYLKL